VSAFVAYTIALSTEKNYLYWVKFFVRWHGRNGLMRHQSAMISLLDALQTIQAAGFQA
jgi:hypothetical protein